MQFIENQQNSDVLSKMTGYLNQLSTNYQLIVHQTFNDSAASIMQKGFGRNGLHGTALFVNPQQIIQTASAMFGQGQAAIHKGSNSLLVLVVPKQIMQQYKIRSVQDLDDHLIELNQQGKIPTVGLPRPYIAGFFHNGQFFANKQFNPDVRTLTT